MSNTCQRNDLFLWLTLEIDMSSCTYVVGGFGESETSLYKFISVHKFHLYKFVLGGLTFKVWCTQLMGPLRLFKGGEICGVNTIFIVILDVICLFHCCDICTNDAKAMMRRTAGASAGIKAGASTMLVFIAFLTTKSSQQRNKNEN